MTTPDEPYVVRLNMTDPFSVVQVLVIATRTGEYGYLPLLTTPESPLRRDDYRALKELCDDNLGVATMFRPALGLDLRPVADVGYIQLIPDAHLIPEEDRWVDRPTLLRGYQASLVHRPEHSGWLVHDIGPDRIKPEDMPRSG